MSTPDKEAQRDASRSVPSLIVSLVVSFLVAGLASTLILGLIPGSRHAALRYACADYAPCTYAYLVLALPGLAVALCTLVGAVAWAIVRVRRHRRASS